MVTTRDIARAMGVSHVTVAAALKGSRKCSPATREKVLEKARSMGWQPNPLVMAFQEAVSAGRTRDTREALAWIVDGPDQRSLWQVQTCLKIARETAGKLGCAIDEFRLSDYGFGTGVSAEQALEKVLKVVRARGIRGVVIPLREFLTLNKVPSLNSGDLALVLLLDEGEPVVSQDSIHNREPFHRVTTDVYANAQLALQQLSSLGYERIGLCLSNWRNLATRGAILGAYQTVRAPCRKAPPFFVGAPPPRDPPKDFARWMRRGRFDAVLCGNTEVRHWLESLGYSIPRDIGLAHFELGPAERNWSGINCRLSEVAESTIHLLTSHLLRNEVGVPEYTKILRIEGVWVNGQTTSASKPDA